MFFSGKNFVAKTRNYRIINPHLRELCGLILYNMRNIEFYT